MHRQRNNPLTTINNQDNMVTQKENKSPEINLRVMEDCDLHDKEFKIAVMKKLNRIQENPERQVSDLRNKINEQKQYLIKEI